MMEQEYVRSQKSSMVHAIQLTRVHPINVDVTTIVRRTLDMKKFQIKIQGAQHCYSAINLFKKSHYTVYTLHTNLKMVRSKK